jgi:hypothetical protein
MRTVGALFPQTARLDDRLPAGWVALTTDDVARSLLEDHGVPVADPGDDESWLDDHGVAFALLRPDRFIFSAGAVEDVPAAVAAWRRLTGARTSQAVSA